jgi:hypothetical protein
VVPAFGAPITRKSGMGTGGLQGRQFQT